MSRTILGDDADKDGDRAPTLPSSSASASGTGGDIGDAIGAVAGRRTPVPRRGSPLALAAGRTDRGSGAASVACAEAPLAEPDPAELATSVEGAEAVGRTPGTDPHPPTAPAPRLLVLPLRAPRRAGEPDRAPGATATPGSPRLPAALPVAPPPPCPKAPRGENTRRHAASCVACDRGFAKVRPQCAHGCAGAGLEGPSGSVGSMGPVGAAASTATGHAGCRKTKTKTQKTRLRKGEAIECIGR
jgi:hypothetical protein